MHGFVTLDTSTNHKWNGLRNGVEELYTRTEQAPNWLLSKYDEALGSTRSMTEEEVASRLVRY